MSIVGTEYKLVFYTIEKSFHVLVSNTQFTFWEYQLIILNIKKMFWTDSQVTITDNKLPFQGNYFILILKWGFFWAKLAKS